MLGSQRAAFYHTGDTMKNLKFAIVLIGLSVFGQTVYGQQSFPSCPVGFACKTEGDTMTITRQAILAPAYDYCPSQCTCAPWGYNESGKPIQSISSDGTTRDALRIVQCAQQRHVSRYAAYYSKRRAIGRLRAHAQSPADEWRNTSRLWEYSATLWQAKFLDCAGESHPKTCSSETDSRCLQRWRDFNHKVYQRRKAAHAPQKPSEPKPEAKPVTLSLEASARFVELENQKSELRKAYNEVLRQQDSLILGAGASSEQRQAVQAWNGQGRPPWAVEGQQITIPVAEKVKP